MFTARGRFRFAGWLIALSVLLVGVLALLSAQSQAPAAGSTDQAQQDQEKKKDQSIPDAPSAVQPANPLPAKPSGGQVQPPGPATAPPPGDSSQPTDNTTGTQPATQTPAPGQKPPINIQTVPEGGATQEPSDDQEKLFTLYSNVNQVMVPVTVTDEDGHMVNTLACNDFALLENGKKQKLNFCTSSPFALSAAVVIDLGMKDLEVQKVNHSFPALEGAFSQFDELSLYTFSNVVGQLTGWGAVGPVLSQQLEDLRAVRGQDNGPPVAGGPLAAGSPVINGVPVGGTTGRVNAPVRPARVLNDAILRAALDLSKRDKKRRKVIFVISDGTEYRSDASYRDVLRVLLSNNIMVYAIGVGNPALPVYGSASKLHIPRFGYTDILPKFVNATGGRVYNELTRTGIEDAYSEAMGTARNQYTLGYLTHAAPTNAYRTFEVLVDRPSCRSAIRPCVNVYAPDGYYPAALK
ncbi:MAG TPA: VWA domain-containing protein [Terriglobales bacterium]